MSDPFSDIREKFKRAEKHINDFKKALANFNATQPYSLRVDTETELGKPFVHILKADPVPSEIRLIAGDAIQICDQLWITWLVR